MIENNCSDKTGLIKMNAFKFIDFQSKVQQLPLISIITVTYNAIDTINATLQSVLAQTYRNIELIIIDGMSKDGTKEIIESLSTNFIYWISEKDNGIYDAMNKGITASKGEWLIFMNSGDTFASHTILEEVFLNNNIQTDIRVLYGNTLVKNSTLILKPPHTINKDFFYFETICHQSIFFNRRGFLTIGCFNLHYKIAADREWLLKAVISNLGFQYFPINIAIWDKEGFSADNVSISEKENVELQRSYFNFFERFLLSWIMRLKNLKRRLNINNNE